jgi:hypothetical protein
MKQRQVTDLDASDSVVNAERIIVDSYFNSKLGLPERWVLEELFHPLSHQPASLIPT